MSVFYLNIYVNVYKGTKTQVPEKSRMNKDKILEWMDEKNSKTRFRSKI